MLNWTDQKRYEIFNVQTLKLNTRIIDNISKAHLKFSERALQAIITIATRTAICARTSPLSRAIVYRKLLLTHYIVYDLYRGTRVPCVQCGPDLCGVPLHAVWPLTLSLAVLAALWTEPAPVYVVVLFGRVVKLTLCLWGWFDKNVRFVCRFRVGDDGVCCREMCVISWKFRVGVALIFVCWKILRVFFAEMGKRCLSQSEWWDYLKKEVDGIFAYELQWYLHIT